MRRSLYKELMMIGVSLCLLLAVVTSCDKKNSAYDTNHILNVPKYISENDEWWNSNRIRLAPENLSFDINSKDVIVNSSLLSIVNDKAYVCFFGFEYTDDDYRTIREISCYNIAPNEEGDLVGVFDANNLVSSEDGFVDNICGFFEDDEKTKMIYSIQYSDMRGWKLYFCDIDMENLVFNEVKEIEIDGDTGISYMSVNKIIQVNGTVFILGYSNGESSIYTLKDCVCQKLKLNNINFIYDFLCDGDNSLLIEAIDESGKKTYLSLDIIEMKVTEVTDFRGLYKVQGHWLLATDSVGNITNTILDFNNTYLSHTDYDASEVVSIGEERILLINDNVLLVINKAQTNPNAGKQIIEAAHLEPLTDIESIGISEFNKNNEDYFVMDNSNYNYWNIFDWNQAMIDYSTERDRVRIEMINELMSDISSGEGPDVVLGIAEYREIQSNNYLLSIDKRIKDLNLCSDEYFTSIIDSVDVHGDKYLLPYEVYLQGILINSKYSEGIESGIKFEEYGRFVNEICNGKDPLYFYDNRLAYFNYCLAVSYDLFQDKTGEMDFDKDEFRILAQYVKDNVPEEFVYNEGVIRYTTIGSIETDYPIYGEYIINNELIGAPSPDGRGVSCFIASSGSITTCSSCQEGSWEFISSMLNPDILENSYGMPVSKTAFKKLAVSPIDGTPLCDAVIDKYESFAASCTSYYSYDLTVSRIIMEEMPSYFSGQKSLDDVIKVINSRVGILVSMRV